MLTFKTLKVYWKVGNSKFGCMKNLRFKKFYGILPRVYEDSGNWEPNEVNISM
jgi:hypothetical protein